MIADLRTLESGATFEADLCVIGAGAAGITIAREFAGRQTSVLLLESGGLEFEGATQALYDYENAGLPRVPIPSRIRFFGGTTNIWDGRTAPLSDYNFSKRDWVPLSGWPIERAALFPFYARAARIIGLEINQNETEIAPLLETPLPAFDTSKVVPQFWQFKPGQPTRFGQAYRSDVESASNIRVLLHANVTNIQAAPNGGRVEYLDVSTLEGRKAKVRARAYVLAAGGIENARILLLSDGVERRGLGNRHDNVGRHFMEHPQTDAAQALVRDPYRFRTTFSGSWLRRLHNAHVLTGIALSHDLQSRQHVLDCGTIFNYGDEETGTAALQRLIAHEYGGDRAAAIRHDVWRVMTDLDGVVVNARQKVMLPSKEAYAAPRNIVLTVDIEQVPNPNSRIMLSEGRERDALGLRRTRIDWRVTDLERRTALAFVRAVGEEFGRLGIGRLQIANWLLDDTQPVNFRDVHHHMGTTRMSSNPETGVVSGDCQVFGVDNLYVAGASVFPTSGFVNPTLTIVTLAIRLADHLKDTLKA